MRLIRFLNCIYKATLCFHQLTGYKVYFNYLGAISFWHLAKISCCKRFAQPI